jgi:hypothetical protein
MNAFERLKLFTRRVVQLIVPMLPQQPSAQSVISLVGKRTTKPL